MAASKDRALLRVLAIPVLLAVLAFQSVLYAGGWPAQGGNGGGTASGVLASDGTAGAPSMAFTNSPTTGIYSTGTNALGIATDGTLRLRVNSTGTVDVVKTLSSTGGEVHAAFGVYSDIGVFGNLTNYHNYWEIGVVDQVATLKLGASETAVITANHATGITSIADATSATLVSPDLNWANGAATKTLTDALCSGQLWTNTGATGLVTFALPDAPAAYDTVSFLVTDADGIEVLCNTGDTATTTAWTTAAAGYLKSTRIGSRLTLRRETATTWIATDVSGTWAKDSATGPGFAFTPLLNATTTDTATWTSNTTVTCYVSHTGSMVRLRVLVACAGAPTSAILHVNYPAAYPIDTSADPQSGGESYVGTGALDDSGTTKNLLQVFGLGTSYMLPVYQTGAGTWGTVDQATPITFGSGDDLWFEVTYPVTGN
jgi:hypothetical protein